MKRKDVVAQSAEISNVKGKRIVLAIGFVLSLLGFLLTAYATATFFVPSINFIDGASVFEVVKTAYIISLSLSFVGVILSVAGANSAKALARLSFFFGTLSFILSCAFLVVVVLFRIVVPLDALGRLGV